MTRLWEVDHPYHCLRGVLAIMSAMVRDGDHASALELAQQATRNVHAGPEHLYYLILGWEGLLCILVQADRIRARNALTPTVTAADDLRSTPRIDRHSSPSSSPINFLDPRLPNRFWDKVQPCPMSGCWIWTGFHNGGGYGQWAIKAPVWKHIYAHRAAYIGLVGPIPDGLQIDHKCRVRCCVNPAHLEVVTQRENLLRGEGVIAKLARRTHCQRGHELTVDNIYASAGFRRCRTCVSENNRRAYEKRTA